MSNCTNPLSHDKFSSRIGQFQGKVFWEEKKLLFGKCRLEIGYSFRGASLSCFRSKLIDIVLTMWCVRRVTEWYSLLLLSLTQAISGDILPSLTNDSFNRENFVKPLEMDIAQMRGGLPWSFSFHSFPPPLWFTHNHPPNNYFDHQCIRKNKKTSSCPWWKRCPSLALRGSPHSSLQILPNIIFLSLRWCLLLHNAKAEFECIFMSIMYAIFLLCLSVIQVDPTSWSLINVMQIYTPRKQNEFRYDVIYNAYTVYIIS